MIFTHKRKLKCEEGIDRYLASSRRKIGKIMEQMDYEVLPIMFMMINSISSGKKRVADIKRDQTWWRNVYRRSWTDKEFKKNLRMNRNTFQFLLETVRPSLTKRTTNAKPNPITVDRQLASTLYRYARGTSFITIGYLFGISKELASIIFHKTSRAIDYFLYDKYVKLPSAENEEEWEAQLK